VIKPGPFASSISRFKASFPNSLLSKQNTTLGSFIKTTFMEKKEKSPVLQDRI